jgi:aspartyl-tRNA(Asn)/glutamyl-tRNA(Gln) amidotransferase subunit A
VQRCLKAIDEREAEVRAWVIVDREGAARQAAELDRELAAGRCRGPLHGMPIGIKDIIDVAGFPTAAGSPLWADHIASDDATLVQRLRSAGGVILGKTVTTQFASFDPPATRNPWNADRTPGGSSSGSAAAVAAGMCIAAIGSQTGGSITRPASFCGVVGCKPTFGRVSVHGVAPFAPSMDHPGPITRCVYDLAALLEVIGGPDDCDPRCSTLPMPVLTAGLAGTTSRAPRIGRLRGLFDDRAEAGMRSAIDRVATQLAAGGAVVVEVPLPPRFDRVLDSHRTIMACEAAATHHHLFPRHADQYLPRIRGLLEEGHAAPAPRYVLAREHQAQLARDILTCFADADVLLTPATLGPAPDTATTGDPAFNSPWSFTGLPTVSLPVSLDGDGLPLAMQLIGRPFQEGNLFQAAAWCEAVICRAAW